ncbi:HET-domain-containing protein [Phaeosphaeriaceae sp. SRC1lsM3a]|nr:HET-domain-containing protein [Stagonospora sp. SRC1lsM3a]
MSGPTQSNLCSVCCKQDLATALKPPMDTDRPLALWQASHILDFHTLCTLCTFLYDVLNMKGLVSQIKDPLWTAESIYLYASAKDEEHGCRVEIQIGNADMASPITLIRSRPVIEGLESSTLLPGASTESLRPIVGRAQEGTVPWPLVRGWIDHCAKTHEHNTPSYPHPHYRRQSKKWASCFRLVDVRHDCVVEADMAWPYAALSYVWGNSAHVRLIGQNLTELMTKGGLHRLPYLPQTFRDAIHVTKQLGLPYLWIDALCIQHDDDADRNHQINGMDQIYREASITIVSVTPNADCQMPGVSPGTRDTTILRYSAPGTDLMYARSSLEASIAQSDWESRGWTLQEKFFSKRLLYFTTEQVFFQCADAIWAEDAVLEPPDFQECSGNATGLLRLYTNSVSNPRPAPPTSTILEAFLQYHDLLQQYITRNLTRDTDILAAFAGILNSFESKLGTSRYGLPELVFGAALLWYGDPYAQPRAGFPSWSWCGWAPQRSQKIAWLVVAASGWDLSPTLRPSIVIDDLTVTRQRRLELDFKPKFVPRSTSMRSDDESAGEKLGRPSHFLDTMSPAFRTFPRMASLGADGSMPPHILIFECDTFFDDKYIKGNSRIALQQNLDYDRKRGRPAPVHLDFLIMSGSRVNDTWFKRRNGTYALPPAPGVYSDLPPTNVNIMLVKTDRSGISERIWAFSSLMEYVFPKTVRKTIHLA